MAREKKIFSPEIRSYGDDITKRWRVEWWEPLNNGYSAKRKADYGNINTGSTIEERHKLAAKLIKTITAGFSIPRPRNFLEQIIDAGTLDWRTKTVSTYKTVATSFTQFIGEKKLSTATAAQVNSFLLETAQKKGSKTTVGKYRTILRALYQRAVDAGKITVNPVEKTKRIKQEHQSLHFFSDAQIQSFKDVDMPAQLWLAIRLLFYCFIRPGEQRHMRIGWINFEYAFIEIPAAYSKNGKTEKVAIPENFLKEIGHLREFPPRYYVLSKDLNPGTEMIGKNWLNSAHKKVLTALRIVGNYAFYSWKHTGAVKAVKAGINIKDLQLQLRHHSLDMVNEYLKNLGILDSEDLRYRFPNIFATADKETADKTAWVAASGNDRTAELGKPGKPFQSVAAALAALPKTGGTLHVGAGTYVLGEAA
jgi:integrase